MSLNVNRSVNDIFYRYKMPALTVKIEGKGNGIKTVIVNMSDVSKSLERPPSYPTKFFGCELGAQTIIDDKNDRFIVNGQHAAERLQDLLDVFIQKFVLCQGCDNPETTLRVTSKKAIEQKCIACGHREYLPLTHKLTTYIINHPPNEVKSKGKSKADKRAKKDKKNSEPSTPTETTSSSSIDPGLATARANVAQRADGDLLDVPAAASNTDENDVDWSVDTSEEAVRARQEQLGAGVAGLTMTDDLEKSIEERMDIFLKFVERRRDQQPFPEMEVLAEAERLECRDKGVMILAEALLNTEDIVPQLKKYVKVFARFTHENDKSQKYLLGAVEKLVEAHPKLMTMIPKIFNFLYENDVIEESAFLHWAEKVSKKFVKRDLSQKIHDNAKPFIEWLKNAESDEDDDDEEDDEDITYDAKVDGVAVVEDDKEEENEESDDDLDIDAI